MKKYTLLFLAIPLILFIIFVAISLLSNIKPSQTTELTPTPESPEKSQRTTSFIPPLIRTAPTFPPDQGKGIDVSAPAVQTSIEQISKLSLPFEKDLRLSDGRTVSLSIPPKDLQNNPWTVTVQLFGINYNTSPGQADYTTEKKAFLEAADAVFTWMAQQGVNPNKVYISWGDKAFIQNRAQTWLQEK